MVRELGMGVVIGLGGFLLANFVGLLYEKNIQERYVEQSKLAWKERQMNVKQQLTQLENQPEHPYLVAWQQHINDCGYQLNDYAYMDTTVGFMAFKQSPTPDPKRVQEAVGVVEKECVENFLFKLEQLQPQAAQALAAEIGQLGYIVPSFYPNPTRNLNHLALLNMISWNTQSPTNAVEK